MSAEARVPRCDSAEIRMTLCVRWVGLAGEERRSPSGGQWAGAAALVVPPKPARQTK